MANQIADIHCHPSGWAFNRMRNTSLERDKEKFHPWTVEQSSLKKQLKGKRAYHYSQCDFGKLVLSGTKLAFGALYPLEKGFFNEQLIGEGQRKPKRHSLLDIIQGKTQGLSKERIAFLQSPEYDYFEELKLEYQFYKSRDNKEEAALVLIYDKNKPTLSKGKYIIAKNTDDVTSSIQKEKEVAIVLTIEGIHALGVGNLKNKGIDISLDQVKERVKALKGEATTEENWEHPVFFITFSHHFDNTFCGHARSFPDITELVFNQRKGCNGPMTPEGLDVIREMLGLNDNLDGTGSKRILVDVKHMSAKGRKSYYDEIIKKYNNFAPNNGHKIPVIASHIGFSGAATLQEQIDDGNLEKDNFKKGGFYAWYIN
nr:dipeptidase [Flammeovirgaceae bacterium]